LGRDKEKGRRKEEEGKWERKGTNGKGKKGREGERRNFVQL